MTRLYGCAITLFKITDAPVGRLGRYGRLLLHLSSRFLSFAFRFSIALAEGTRDFGATIRFSRHVIRTEFPTIPIERSRPELERPTENNTKLHAKKRNVKSSRTLYGAGRGRASLLADVIARPPAWTSLHTHGECRPERHRICTNLHDRPRQNCKLGVIQIYQLLFQLFFNLYREDPLLLINVYFANTRFKLITTHELKLIERNDGDLIAKYIVFDFVRSRRMLLF